jgi:AbrB family looped-hinge helix DNA binding protein
MSGATATVTSKGQVTIPKKIREALAIREHTQLLFVLEGDSARVMPVGVRTLAELAGSLPATGPWPGMAEARRRYREDLADRS